MFPHTSINLIYISYRAPLDFSFRYLAFTFLDEFQEDETKFNFKVVASSELIKHTDLRSLGLFKVTQTLCGYHVTSSGFTLIIFFFYHSEFTFSSQSQI